MRFLFPVTIDEGSKQVVLLKKLILKNAYASNYRNNISNPLASRRGGSLHSRIIHTHPSGDSHHHVPNQTHPRRESGEIEEASRK